ncbi:RIP metalloprotease RseP [Flavobacterium sp. JP2137]|uniref:RIP metalloprotease RseP n=1 Tax=Flavobacterium sp. JP2137 TaxID=3414510 RepID=UPI003D2FCAF7
MEIVIKLSQFLLSLSLLIVLHELGHFIPAKIFKTRVEKFYLFFDVKFSLFKKKIGDTVYGIGWLPLGGYVKIAGMIDESMDTDQMKQEPQPWEFRSKPAWQRLIIMLGGVTVNFVLAFVIYIGMTYYYGDLFIKNEDIKNGVWVVSPALEKAGLQTGDKIVAVDGQQIQTFNEINGRLLMGKEVIIERDGEQKNIVFPVDFIDQFMQNNSQGLVSLRIPFIIAGAPEDSPNAKVFELKDQVTSIAGQPIAFADEVQAVLDQHKGETVPATVTRNGEKVDLSVQINEEGKLNMVFAGGLKYSDMEQLGLYKINKEQYGLLESVPIGLNKGKEKLLDYGKQLKMFAKPETGAYKGLGGFLTIFNIFPSFWSWEAFWSITAVLSIMLGVMNLLPIPALDGGHVMFLLYEIITGRKPSDKFMENAQMVGFFILIGLLLFANGNDIYKAIFK